MGLFANSDELRIALIELARQAHKSGFPSRSWADRVLRNEGFAKSLAGFMFNAISNANGRFCFKGRLTPVIKSKVWRLGGSTKISSSTFADLEEDERKDFRRVFKLGLHDSLLHKLVGRFLCQKLESVLLPSCFAYRPGRGQAAAVKDVRAMQKNGDKWVVRLDVKDFNETVSHEVLAKVLETRLYPILSSWEQRIVKGTIHALLQLSVQATQQAGVGLIVGSGLTPALTNLYLSPLDEYLDHEKIPAVRYGDDVIAFCSTRQKARTVLRELRRKVGEGKQKTSRSPAFGDDHWDTGIADRFRGVDSRPILAARRKKQKTDILNPGEPFDFIGFEFAGERVFIRQATLAKVKSRIEQFSQRMASWIAAAVEKKDPRYIVSLKTLHIKRPRD